MKRRVVIVQYFFITKPLNLAVSTITELGFFQLLCISRVTRCVGGGVSELWYSTTLRRLFTRIYETLYERTKGNIC